MKKRAINGLILLIVIVALLTGFAIAVENSSSGNEGATVSGTSTPKGSSEKGYQCLSNLVKNKQGFSLQEAIFSVLALGGEKNLLDSITNEKSSNEACWPKNGCKIKDTAQVSLAYERIGKNNEDIEKWIISKNATASELIWYLEIDISNHVPSSCTLKYDGSEKKISVKEDMKLDGSPGACFVISSSGYWLTIRDGCLDKEIEISCDQDFISTLLYEKKPAGATVFVSSETHGASALGSTKERVNSKCLKTDSGCDYEGTLWAALALNKGGRDVSSYLPYLVALAENNQRYFPSAILYILTGSDDQFANVIQNQKQSRSWRIIGSPYSEFYDTSLGILALQSGNSGEINSVKNYLLNIQGTEGCWNNNNIRDTGFILYTGWPQKSVSSGGGGGDGKEACEIVSGQACENMNSCLDAGGRVLSNFKCASFGTSCCSVDIKQQSCNEQKGFICAGNQKCDGRSVPSIENGVCCLDGCINVAEEPTCEVSGGLCKSSCNEDEEKDSTQTCLAGQICCQNKIPEQGGISALLIVLIILIILVILAIVFRNKIRLWIFKFKGKAKSSPVTKPAIPPNNSGFNLPQIFRPRPGYPTRPATTRPQTMPQKRAPPSQKDREFEETLKKLKDMSK
ncbi:hypothetical protein HYW75_04080 [Candidatus Pacearchaeota archaeon]|nr:hypothetical protein [Candidatus Pacearchaeota archaeon]